MRSGAASGQMGTCGQHSGILFPVSLSEDFSGSSAQKCPSGQSDPDAPDPLATLAHCVRIRPDTTATDQDKAALAEHFKGLNGTAEAAGERLWNYWKAAPSPTVGEFLAHERRAERGRA